MLLHMKWKSRQLLLWHAEMGGVHEWKIKYRKQPILELNGSIGWVVVHSVNSPCREPVIILFVRFCLVGWLTELIVN